MLMDCKGEDVMCFEALGPICSCTYVWITNANDPLGGRGKWYKFEGAFISMFSILILENLERNLNAAVLEPFPVVLEGSWQMQEHV